MTLVVSEGGRNRRSSSSVREDEEYMRQLRAERLRLGLPENPSPQSDTRAQDGAEDCGVACGERRLYTARPHRHGLSPPASDTSCPFEAHALPQAQRPRVPLRTVPVPRNGRNGGMKES